MKPIAENVEHYKTFLAKFKVQRGTRAKRMSKRESWPAIVVDALILLVEQVYTEKFVADANYFKATLKESQKERIELDRPTFPLFVHDYLRAKIKSAKQLTQVRCPDAMLQAAVDLVSSIEFHRKQCLEADIFSKFMEETFDNKDLIFFLYIRSLIEKELDIHFADLKEQNLKSTPCSSL